MSRDFPQTKSEFEEVYSQVPRLTVETVVVREGKVLLTQRAHETWKGMWHIPGSTVYYREAIEETIMRIGREELGCEIALDKLLGVVEWPGEEAVRGFGYTVSLEYLCSLVSEPVGENSEGEAIAWFDKLPVNTIKENAQFLINNLGFEQDG